MTQTPFCTRTSACSRETRVSDVRRRGALRPMISTASSSTRKVVCDSPGCASMRMSLSTMKT